MYLSLQLGSYDFLERLFSAAQMCELYHSRHNTQIPVEIVIIHGAAREFVSYELS